MRIPKRLRICGLEYGVCYVRESLGDGVFGACDSNRGLILLSKDFSSNRSVLEDTFFHELTHAVLQASGSDKHVRNDEYFTSAFTPAMLATLRDARMLRD